MSEAYIQVRDDKGRFIRRRKVILSRERVVAFLAGVIVGVAAGLAAFAGM